MLYVYFDDPALSALSPQRNFHLAIITEARKDYFLSGIGAINEFNYLGYESNEDENITQTN